MDDRLSYRPSRVHLFTVRLWAEEIDVEHIEWRGRVQYILTGEVHYFRSWQQLIDRLATIVQTEENPSMASSIPSILSTTSP